MVSTMLIICSSIVRYSHNYLLFAQHNPFDAACKGE